MVPIERHRKLPAPYPMAPSPTPYDLPFSHNNARLAYHSALWPFKVIQGHRFLCYLKANMQVFISDHQQPRPYVAPFSHNIYVTYNRQTTHRIAVSRQKYIFCGGGAFFCREESLLASLHFRMHGYRTDCKTSGNDRSVVSVAFDRQRLSPLSHRQRPTNFAAINLEAKRNAAAAAVVL